MSGGGKGGSNQTVAFYYVPIAFAICEGPIVGIKQIWAGGDLIYSDSQPVAVNTYQGGGKKSGPTVSTSYQQFSSSTQNDVQTGGSALGPWTCYLGTETQPADPTIGEGVAYRGLAYIVFNPLNIGPGATVPPLTFEVVTAGSLAPPSVVGYVTGSNFEGPLAFDDNGNAIATFDTVEQNNNVAWVRIGTGGTTGLQIIQAGGNASLYQGYGLVQGYGKCFGYFNTNNLVGYDVTNTGVADGVYESGWKLFEYDTTSGVMPGSLLSVPLPNQSWYNLAYDGQYLYALWSEYGAHLTIIGVGAYGPDSAPPDTAYAGGVGIPVDDASPNQTGAVNGVFFACSNNADNLWLLNAVTGSSQFIAGSFGGCVTDGTNIWATYTDTNGKNWLGCFSTSGAVISTAPLPSGVIPGYMCWQDGNIWVVNSVTLYKITQSGVLLHQIQNPNNQEPISLQYDGVYLWATSYSQVTKIDPGDRVIIPGTMDLPAAVTILCERAGIQQFDVSQLPPTPVNFVRGDTVTARSMLQRLSQAYFFSMVDSGGVLKFVPWGQPSLGVIPLEDLGFDKVSVNAQTPFTASRISGVDLPRSVKIRYFSPAMNWERYEQIFALESYDSGKEVTLDLPLILDDQTAYNIAALACTLPHAERMQYSFTTSYKWLCVEPGDVWTLPFGTVRIQTVKLGQKNGIPVIDFTACIDGINALAGAGYAKPALPNYQPGIGGITALLAPANLSATTTVSSATPHPIATAPQIQQTVPNAGTPKMVLTEPPPLRSTDTGMRFYAGAYSTGNAFPGAAIFQSTDGGNTYSQLLTVLSATGAGYANTVLGQPNATEGFYTWDTVNTVDIYMLGGGTLGPLTDLQVMNGGNGAMLGYELIQFANATLMTDSLGNPFYRLSRLLRGRRGTEWAMGAHQVGDPFYLIPSALVKESYTPPMLNNPMLYKVVMMGGDLGNAPAVSYEPSGASLMQWAVCDPACTKDSAGDWTVSWTPRARYNGDWASGYIPTLDSDTAGWSIDVLNGTTVTRTIAVPLTQTAPWQTVYTAAMQSADGFTPGQSGITFNIYQLSATVGRGAVRSITTP